MDSNVLANIEITAGKWSASEAVKDAENRLEFEKTLGYHQKSRLGLGSITIQKIPPKNTQDYPKLMCSMIEKSDNHKLHAKFVQLSSHRQWIRCCEYIKPDLSSKNLLAMPQPLLSSCFGATYYTLSSPSNLYRWHITPEAVCFFVSGPFN